MGGLEDGDVLVVAQKAVSKAEGRVEETDDVVAAILREARAVRRRRGDLVIAETKHGFVCASAGVDKSNTPGDGWVVLLPEDPGRLGRPDPLGARRALRRCACGDRQRLVRAGVAAGDDGCGHRRRGDAPAPATCAARATRVVTSSPRR